MITTEVRVRYADTDAMGVVYHANYLVWFEVGRGELMRSWGLPYADFEKRGIFVPVVDIGARYIASARYDDLVTIETRVAEVSPAKIRFAYRILRSGDGQLLCEGHSLHAFVSSEGGRPVALRKAAPDLYDLLAAKLA